MIWIKKILPLILGLSLALAAVEEILFDEVTLRLENDIKEATRRQAIIAHNIANAEIEGYQPIRFEEELRELRKTPDGVSKDRIVIEDEMVKMTKNRMRHQTALKLYTLKTGVVKTVLSQGK
ncbi:flagellar basal-body rod protein FlgB [Candidatus Termititenax persephonae]|uniref:Flagellar basal-body rod protein FlgB n=1 Tax=Candidatus Termititenax persephonae TaxID=2218525 RepID=A0A388TEU7_9BACT|nr:flagellar basal-body rod protein FlgB [Candidatus Termititenax persephonae]